MRRLLATLLALIALPLAATESPAQPDPPQTSPSGKLHLRLGASATLPGAVTPVTEGEEEEMQVLRLEEKGRAPFDILAPAGRCTPCWSADEAYLALAIQMDRANFSLIILRLSDRKSITCDFTALDQQRMQLFQKAGLVDAAAASAVQLRGVRCTSQQCTGSIVSGTAQHTGTLTFAIDFSQHEWTPGGTVVAPRLTASELKAKE